MKYRIFLLTSLLLIAFTNLALSETQNKGFYATTYYSYKGKLLTKAPRSADAVEVKTWQGNISENMTWESDKIITGDVTIETPATLTIKPGVTLFFPKMDVDENGIGDTDFIVKGRLNCQGLPNKKVVFTSYQDNKQNKDWGGIDFQSQTGLLSTISNAEISYAYEAVSVKAQNVTFNSCHILNINQYGMKFEEMESDHEIIIRKSIIEECGTFGLDIDNGVVSISNSQILNNSGYGVNMSKGVLSIDKLTLSKNGGYAIKLKSEVSVNANELVSDSNSGSGLELDGVKNSEFWNSEFINNNKNGILMDDSTPNFTNCIIMNNKWNGVEINGDDSEPVFNHCKINTNEHAGLFFEDESKGNVSFSNILENKGLGIKVTHLALPDITMNNIYNNIGKENTLNECNIYTKTFADNEWRCEGKQVKYHPSDNFSARKILNISYKKDGDNNSALTANCYWYYRNYTRLYTTSDFLRDDFSSRRCRDQYNMPLRTLQGNMNRSILIPTNIFLQILNNENCPNCRAWVTQYTYKYDSKDGFQVAAVGLFQNQINLKNNYWQQKATESSVNYLIYDPLSKVDYDNYKWEPIPNAGVTLSVHIPQNASGLPSSQVAIPIKVINYTDNLNIISFNFSVTYNSEILTAKGVSTLNSLTESWEVFSDTSDRRKITISGFNLDPLENGKGTLLYLLFDVNSEAYANDESTLEFSDFSVNTNINDIVLENGNFTVIKELHKISGNVVYFNIENDNPIAIPQTTLTIDGGENPIQIQTDKNGEYAFPALSAGNFIVAPSKEAEIQGFVITPFDASLVARYALNLIELNDYQLTAADVDSDAKVTVFDASTIAKYTVGLINNFDKGTWLFDPPSNAYTLDRDMESQYKGIVVGDVSGNWTPAESTNDGPPSEFMVRMPDISEVSTNDEIQISIETDIVTGSKIYSYFIEIEYNPDIVSFTDISKTETLSANWPNPAFYTGDSGLLRIAAFGTEPLKGAGTLINLKGIIKGNDDEITPLSFNRFAFNEGSPKVNIENGSILIGENPLSVSPEKIEIQKNAGQLTLDIMTGDAAMNWEASTNDPWISFDGDNHGMGSGQLIVNYTDNPGTARSGAITISSTEAANGPQTVSVYQFGMYQLQIEDISADPGEQIFVPIIMKNPDNESMEGIHITLEYDPTILDFIEMSYENSIIEDGIDNNTVVTGQNTDINGQIILSIYFNEENFTKAGVLTTLTFNVIGEQGNTSAFKFSRAIINAKHASADDGLFIIGYTVSGYVGYYSVFNREVPGVKVIIDDFTATSNDQGYFYLNNIPADGFYTMTPSKTTDLGGLKGTDASLILQHTVNKVDFDCNEKLAADTNQDGMITPTDAAKVAKFAVKYETGQEYCMNDDCTHWIFTTDQINACEPDIPILYTNKREYAPLESNMEDQDFYAVRLGDVNSSWTKDQSRSLSRKNERSNDFSDLPEIRVAPGDIFSVPIVLTDDQSVTSALISVSFDSDIVQTQEGSIENGFLSDFQLEQEIAVPDISAFILYGSQAVQGSGKLLDLRFKAIGKKQRTIISLNKLECNDLLASGGFKINTLTVRQFLVTMDVPEPEIFTIDDQIIEENSTANALAVTINMPSIPEGLASLSADSSNTSLIPVENITFEGDGDVKTVNIQPIKGQYGTGIITITVTDSYGRSASSTFTITVDPLPDSQISAIGCGKVTINGIENNLPWSGRFDYSDANIPVTAIPCNTGWVFDHWSGDISSSNATISIPTGELKVLKAHFIEKPVYSLEIDLQSLNTLNLYQIKINGTNQELPWSDTFVQGTSVEIEVVNQDDFQHWTGDVSSEQATINLTINNDMHLTAIFYAFDFILKQGWQLVSLPFTPIVDDIFTLLPEDAYAYRYSDGLYVEISSGLRPGIGYWLFSPVDDVIKMAGQPYTNYNQRMLQKGWNLIGGLSDISQIKSIPEGAIDSIYEYKDGVFVEVETIKPGYGYFVYVTEDCEIMKK